MLIFFKINIKKIFQEYDQGIKQFRSTQDLMFYLMTTVKPVLSGHSKIDKAKVLKTNGSFMKVKSIAECSSGAFCNTFDLHLAIIGHENQFLIFFLGGRFSVLAHKLK